MAQVKMKIILKFYPVTLREFNNKLMNINDI